MREVLGGKLQSRLAALKGGGTGEDQLGGSCMSLSTVVPVRPRTRSCSLETILDDSAPLPRQQLFLSNDSLASCSYSNRSKDDSPALTTPQSHLDFTSVSKATPVTCGNALGGTSRNRLPVASLPGLSVAQRSHSLRPCSVGSCLDIVIETREEDIKETKWQGRAASCLNVSTPADQHHYSTASRPPSLSSYQPSSSSCHPFSFPLAKAQGSHATTGPAGPRPASSTSNLWTLPAPAVVRRCLSSLDVSKPSRPVSLFKAPVCVPTSSSQPPPPKPENSKALSPSTCLSACLWMSNQTNNI